MLGAIIGDKYGIFFHGEAECPQSFSSAEQRYWGIEAQYYRCRFPDEEQRAKWEHDAQTICLKDKRLAKYMKSDKIPLEVKGMLAFSVQDYYYHANNADIVYDFAKVVGEHYNV